MSSSGPTIQQTKGTVIDEYAVIASINDFKAVSLALSIIAVVITLLRLGERTCQRRLWLDDAWAALAMVLSIMLFVLLYEGLSNFGGVFIVSLSE